MKPDREYYAQGPQPETEKPRSTPPPWSETKTIGAPLPRIDAYERVSGTAVYPSDVTLPDMLYGAILRSPHPHARIVKIDTARAEKMPGVRVVLTQKSPEADIDWYYSREIHTKMFDPHIRHEGEEIAAVAAESPYQARDALRAIEVEYEILPFVADERAALEQGAVPVHEGGNLVGDADRYERGDVTRGFDEADVVVERSFRTECEVHVPMELHGCVAKWDRDLLTIWESTQGVYGVQRLVAWRLGLPLSKVRVIGSYMGGGFGSKLAPGKYTLIAALMARKAARPVKLILSREETYLAVGNRPPTNMRLKAGIKNDGTLTALDFTAVSAAGAYPASGTGLVDWQVRDLYACPNVRCETKVAYIHAGPARPMRAPGHPQGSWALEQVIDELAEKIGIDPVELRLKNIPIVSQADDGTPPYSSNGLPDCLSEGAREFGWEEARTRRKDDGTIRRGVGMAACQWVAGAGGPPSTVIVKLFGDGSANLNMGASDIGTGTKTVMAMIVAEELGIPIERIQVEHADTATTQYATPSGGSKTIPTESPAVRDAALEVKRQLLEMAAEQLEATTSELFLEEGEIVSAIDGEKRLPLQQVQAFQQRGVIVGIGYRGPNPQDKRICPFAAQFCEVEVNMKTGEVEITRFLGAHDSGRVMNRKTYDNQVFGGITMGIGLASTEQRILDPQTGKMVNLNGHDYKVPTALDVPPAMTSVPIDPVDREANSVGAKGLGEPVTIPTAAAIANAVYHATGLRITESPIVPGRVLGLLADAGKGE